MFKCPFQYAKVPLEAGAPPPNLLMLKIRIFYHVKGNDHLEVWQTSLSTNTGQLRKGFIEY
jgi:hypothetical protein